MHLLKLCCSLCCSPEYLQHVLSVLTCKIQEKYFLLHAACDWFASQHWAGEIAPILRLPCSSTGSFAPSVKWSTRPHGLFALPAALHAWARTCHFKHCSYVIFTSNMDEIRGVSIVKILQLYVIFTSVEHFVMIFLNTDTCVKIRQHYCSFIIWAYFFTGIHRLTLVIKHWKNRFYLKDVANGTRNMFN